MHIVILDAGTLGDDLSFEPLRAHGTLTTYVSTAPDEIAERLRDADVAILNKVKMNAETLRGVDGLKLICVAATGYDNIDLDYCREHGIAVCNVPAYSTDSVAQITAAMVLSLTSHLTAFRDFVHGGAYSEGTTANRLTPYYRELSSMTWGVVGGGGIGTRVARIAEAMGCRVLMCRRKPDERFEQVDIDTLCEQSDIVSLHVPLTDETRGMIDARRLEKMKDGAILVNVARGAVSDEEAVARAVESGKLGGLGVDVYSTEPFREDHPFYRLLSRENVCLTPHMAWGSVESRERCLAVICENIRCFFEGNSQNRVGYHNAHIRTPVSVDGFPPVLR